VFPATAVNAIHAITLSFTSPLQSDDYSPCRLPCRQSRRPPAIAIKAVPDQPAGLLFAIGDIMTKVPSAVRLRDRHHGRLKARANRLFTSIS
jgi:hypothetical protein